MRGTGSRDPGFAPLRPAAALLALAALAGAGCREGVDPCGPHAGTCIAVEVEADTPQTVSRLEVTLQLGQSEPVQRTTQPPSGPTGFPLVFPVVLGSYAGTVRIFITAPDIPLAGQTALTVSRGEHVRVRVVLSSGPVQVDLGPAGDQPGPPDGGASAPAARAGGAMAFFPDRGTLVLFGGLGEHNQLLGDTWEWREGAWRPLQSPAAPAPRLGASMAYDPVHKGLVLCCGAANKTLFNDTWRLEASGHWTLLLDNDAPRSPPARAFGPMAPTLSGTLLLAGGLRPDTSDPLTDLWEYTGDWRKLSAPLPTQLRGHALVRTASALLLVGHDPAVGSLQLWMYDAMAPGWIRLLTPPRPLPGRRDFAAVYNPAIDSLYLHGGATPDESQLLDDTLLVYRMGPHVEWGPVETGTLGARRYTQAGYDPHLKGVLLFGGHTGQGVLGDTWLLRPDTSKWEQLAR